MNNHNVINEYKYSTGLECKILRHIFIMLKKENYIIDLVQKDARWIPS